MVRSPPRSPLLPYARRCRSGTGADGAGLEPVTRAGDVVPLEPLHHGHSDELATAVSDGRLWELWYTSVPTPAGMAADVEVRLARQAAGEMPPFVVRRNADGAVVGATTFCHADLAAPRLEVGHTSTVAPAQRLGVNA